MPMRRKLRNRKIRGLTDVMNDRVTCRRDADGGPLVAGIVNATGDSFSEGRTSAPESAPGRALRLIGDGADWLDLGGESTRPGSTEVPPAEELARLLPVLDSVKRAHPEAVVSIDTRHAETARRCVEHGAAVINDVSMLRHDPALVDVAAETGVMLVVCHSRGTPDDMQSGAYFDYGADVAGTVAAELAETAERAVRAGVKRENIWFDPGFGFAKTVEQNFELAANMTKVRELGKIFVGVSRKSFIGAASGVAAPAERLPGTLAMELFLADRADVLRTHDVAALRQALAVRRMLNRRG